jgi:primosomal protein N' (replication factor Y)
MKSDLFAEIVVFSALEQTLHYRVPVEFHAAVGVGKRVLVPLGRREAVGLLIQLQAEPPALQREVVFRDILAVVDETSVVPAELIALCRWIAKYYFYPLGEVLQHTLPPQIQLQPERCWRITAAGRELAAKSEGSHLLGLLNRNRFLSHAEIKQYVSALPAAGRELKELEETGLAEAFYVWHDPPIRPRLVKQVTLCATSGDLTKPADSAQNDGARQIIRRLETAGGSAVLKDLRRHVKNADYWVRKLQREGKLAVEVGEELRHGSCAQNIPPTEAPIPTSDQAEVLETICPSLENASFKPFLLYGVTGSGKTEIYLWLVEKALQSGRGVLVLVPEIALSTQLEALFRQRVRGSLAIWHSALPPGARYDQWRQALAGKTPVILGVRSAVFMPIQNLGLIIVDEEHDSSYKQEDRLRYHARDVALIRARMLGIPIVLGSATPSLQSLRQALNGRYTSLRLPRRVCDRPLPAIEVVDMRRERGKFKIISGHLRQALAETLEKNQQAIFFLNRRGFNTVLLCRLCGEVTQCPHCSVSLTYHRKYERLRCHYCGWEQPLVESCPRCEHASLTLHGFGTEKVEQELQSCAPLARIVRMDRDTVGHSRDLVSILDRMRNGEADVLLGTQMVTKGHDFPNITLVGVINADVSLQISDFRAGENTAQLLVQAAGRAGRGKDAGRVILQTYNPQHFSIRSVLSGDYLGFCEQELAARKRLQYPPFTKLVKLLVTAAREETAEQAAKQLAQLCRTLAVSFHAQEQPVAVLGPAPAPLWKLKDRYRWHLFVKAWTNPVLQRYTETLLAEACNLPELRRVELTIDRDPLTTL